MNVLNVDQLDMEKLIPLFLLIISFSALGQLDPSIINSSDSRDCVDCLSSPVLTPRSFDQEYQTDCIKELSCEERVFMSHLSSVIGDEKDPKVILRKIDRELRDAKSKYGLNVDSQKVKSSLIAYLKKIEALQKTPEQKEAERIAINRLSKVAPFLDAYMDSLSEIGKYLTKLNQQPWYTTWSQYVFTDTESPLEWMLNTAGVETPEWKDTPLATALEGVRHFRSLLIQEYKATLKEEGMPDPEISKSLSHLSSKVWAEHDKMIMEGIENADEKVFQGLNKTKKIYGATLGALMIPGGIALKGGSAASMLLALSVNGAGWSLTANSFKEFIDAGIESSGNEDISYWCAYAKQGVEDYGLNSLWSEASLGLALGLVGGGLAKGAMSATSTLGKAAYATVGGGIAVGGLGMMGKTYAAEINDLHQLEKDYHWNEQSKACLSKAKMKLASGAAVDIGTLYLGLKGIGEPKFTTPVKKSGPKIEVQNGALKPSVNAKKLILDLSEEASQAKSKMPDDVQRSINQQTDFFDKYGTHESPYIALNGKTGSSSFLLPKGKHVADFIAKNFSDQSFMIDSLTILKGEFDTFLAGRPYSNKLFDEFIEIQAKKLDLDVKVVPDTCCRDFSEFSKYVDGVIIDAGVEVNPHGRYGHALQTLTIAKHVDRVFGRGTYKSFIGELSINQNVWRNLFDIDLKEHQHLKSGLKVMAPDGSPTRADVMINFSQPEFVSMLARRIGMIDDVGGKYTDVIRSP